MKLNKKLVISLIGGTIIFLILIGVVGGWFGGVGQLIAYINGESVYFFPTTIDIGQCEAGEKTVVVFHMTNLTSKDITIVSEQSSCPCTVSEQMPITAPSGKTIDLKINVTLSKYDSSFDQTVAFFTNERDKLVIHPVRIVATIPVPLPKPVVDP
ncbi:MAG: DUF1573 domain-containing protein [Planctomycetaceae bacterium]|jgi:hypothetical protein|nr:DUF1573 domain-containing protein [Planctomycetaceae bacterium]